MDMPGTATVSAPAQSAFSGCEILLAEDDAVTTLVTRRFLQKAGYQVTTVENGQQALKLLGERFFPIVLTDWEMPELDGPELCRRIRQMEHAGYVYTILLTARTSRDHILAGLEAGADDYVTKPVDEAELVARLKTAHRIIELEQRLRAANEQAVQLSITDALTSVYNRRHFMGEFPRELERARRFGTPVSLVMCDVDHFKRINDERGHQAGDEVLREVAAVLRGTVRPQIDWIARYGGEEFAVVLPGADHKGALIVAERLRANLAAREIATPKGIVRATASFGVASEQSAWPAPGVTAEALIAAADLCLYASKHSGRNCVTGQTALPVTDTPRAQAATG